MNSLAHYHGGHDARNRSGDVDYESFRALWACVLQVAVSDLADPETWEETRNWFLTNEWRQNGFRAICEVLDWNPDAILEALREKLDRKPDHFGGAIYARRHWGR